MSATISHLHKLTDSPVFAQMITLAAKSSPPEPVTLQLESDFEDHETLHRFLVLVTNQTFDAGGFPDGDFWDWRWPLHHLLQFLDKWGCERCVSSLRAIGATAIMRDELQFADAFVFCALLNDPPACRGAILRYARNWTDHPGQDGEGPDHPALIFGTQRGSMFTLGESPYELFCVLPQAYAYGLLRAGVECPSYWEDEDDIERFADKFVEVVEAALQVERHREYSGQQRDMRLTA